MPRLSDSMEEGTILKWLKADGEPVRRGDELVEIETDKATMTYEADADGMLRIAAAEGDTLEVGAVIATLLDPATPATPGDHDDQPAAPRSIGDQRPNGQGSPSTPSTAGVREDAGGLADVDPAAAEAGGDAAVAASTPTQAAAAPKTSPVARRIARERGLDLATIRGTGPGGRIVKADVLGEQRTQAPEPPPQVALRTAEPRQTTTASAPPPETPATAPTPATPPPPVATSRGGAQAKGDVSVQPPTRVQQVVARRMAEAKASQPEFSLLVEVDMLAATELRADLKHAASNSQAVPSFNDMVVKAAAAALRAFPRANGAYRDGAFEVYSRVNIGVAVAAENALIVPTVFDADVKALGQITRETRALAERVRAGAITPPELAGSTFTVSNLGMYGMRSIVPVLNSGQAAILGVGAIEQRAVVVAGRLEPRPRMGLTLVCDHRILYGADAAQLLARIRDLLQHPLRLAL
jgi:pyruvate dehydrogenase E2 component (dihydrolipoamide acetyltransferase)